MSTADDVLAGEATCRSLCAAFGVTSAEAQRAWPPLLSMLDGRAESDALIPPDRLRNSYRWKPDQGTQLDLPSAHPYVPPHRRTTGAR